MGLRSGPRRHSAYATLDAVQIPFEPLCPSQGSQDRATVGAYARLWSRTPGRHAFADSVCGYQRVLLPLRRRPHAGRLHKDVRAAEVCEAVVGYDLRETALQASGRGLELRTARSTPNSDEAGPVPAAHANGLTKWPSAPAAASELWRLTAREIRRAVGRKFPGPQRRHDCSAPRHGAGIPPNGLDRACL